MKDDKLIIFDCDGVLVDSEVITNRVFAKMLNELGIPVSLDDMFEQFVGRSMTHCLELITKMLGGPLPANFVDRYQTLTAVALESELKEVRGISKLLDQLDALGVPFCVASNGTPEKMKTTLGITGLLNRFEGKLFSVTQVARGKPAPDIYLYAASKHGIAPSACHVIEDSPAGVTAGVAARMTVYGYDAHTPKQCLIEAGAHYTFSDMHRLPELLFS